MDTRFEKLESRLDEKMDTRFEKMESRLDEMMAMLRQSLEENKNRVNAVDSKQQQAADEQREHLVLLRENRTSTELYRAEIQGATQRVEMMQDNMEGFKTDLQADARRHELQVDATVKQIQAHNTASSLADTMGRHDLDTTPPGSVYGATPGEADQDAVRVGAHRPLEESKEEPATLSHHHQPPGSNSLTGIIIGEQVPFTETLREFAILRPRGSVYGAARYTVSVGTPKTPVELTKQIAPSYRSNIAGGAWHDWDQTQAMIDPWLPPPWHTAWYICI